MQITKTLLFSHGVKITAYAVESYTWSAPSPADVDPEGDLDAAELDARLAVTRPEAIAEDAWTLQSRWTTEAEAITEARALIAHDANGLTREGCTVEITGDGLMHLWRVGDSIARSVTVRVREVSVRVPASDVPTPTGTPATRLARLAIELSGVVPDPRSLAALEAAERGTADTALAHEACVATEDARGRVASDVARACAAAASSMLGDTDGFARSAAAAVLDVVRHRGLDAAREVVSATNGRPWTEADADAERAALQAITPALRAALARVQEILPGYTPDDDDARKWLDRPETRTYEVEGAGADQVVEGASSEDAAMEAACIQYGTLGTVTVRYVDGGSDSTTLGVYEVEVDGVPQSRRLTVREARA